MTEVCRRMLDEDNDDSPEKCRERRRRRIEMRRLSSISAAGSTEPASQTGKESPTESSSPVAEGKRIKTTDTREVPENAKTFTSEDDIETSKLEMASGNPVEEPVYGTMSVSGRLREMEDAIAVRTSLCRPEISLRRPVHFFGVYDGHGGPHVAGLCREKMHVFVKEELMRVQLTEKGASVGGGSCSSNSSSSKGADEWKENWVRAMKRSFERMDEAALSTCACGSVGYHCGCHPMEVALAGSTAVVAVLTPDRIVVANCGDSRAVLCRGRKAIPLTTDHKPDRSDELARIKAAGGRVIFVNGARVEGILAMSRAIVYAIPARMEGVSDSESDISEFPTLQSSE